MICPKCNKEYDIDYFNKRGVCSVCGHKLLAPNNQCDISKTTKNENNPTEITGKLKSISMKELKSIHPDTKQSSAYNCQKDKATQIKHISSKTISSFNPKKEKKQTNTGTSEEKSSTSQRLDLNYDDPIFSNDNQSKQESFVFSENTFIENTYINDPIFLNTDGPLDIEEANDISNQEIDDIDVGANKNDEEDDDYITIAPTKGELSGIDIHLPFKFERLPIVKSIAKMLYSRKHKNDEHYETTELIFNFNKDGFYDDVEPDAPPDIDIIQSKTIAKVVASIVSIFLFIVFIIYYA